MRIDKDNIEEFLIRAIREKATLERMKELDRKMEIEAAFRRRMRIRITSIAAAAVVLVACGDIGLRMHTRNVGFGYEFTETSRGASTIQDYLDNKQLKDAESLIEESRLDIAKELEDPSYDDPDYITNLKADLQELDFLEAVCHLRQGKFFKVRKELKAIAEGGGYYAAEASGLLVDLL